MQKVTKEEYMIGWISSLDIGCCDECHDMYPLDELLKFDESPWDDYKMFCERCYGLAYEVAQREDWKTEVQNAN